MKVLIITSSPNHEGLTEACGDAARQGVEAARGEARMIRLNDLQISRCQACDNGWGTCLREHVCQVQDDFQALHQSFAEIDGLVVVTPVYWGETSESAKAFFDRLRRCEATLKDETNKLRLKPFIAVAAAGGSGRGTLSCLSMMERMLSQMNHMQVEHFEYIGVTQKNRSYMLDAIRSAAEKMVADNS